MNAQADLVFKAIADPTRREIFHLLATAGRPLTVGEIADRFPATRQGVRKHLRQLETSDLVRVEKAGRRRLCAANPAALFLAYRWLATYERFWTQKLADLGAYLEAQTTPSSTQETQP